MGCWENIFFQHRHILQYFVHLYTTKLLVIDVELKICHVYVCDLMFGDGVKLPVASKNLAWCLLSSFPILDT